MEDSMQKLRSDPIDLMQVHNLVDASTQLATLRGVEAIGTCALHWGYPLHGRWS